MTEGPIDLFRLSTLTIVLALARSLALATDGQLDSTYGVAGVVETGLSGSPVLVMQPDGKLLVGDLSGIERYDLDGDRDPSFGAGGFVLMRQRTGGLVLQPDGKILWLSRLSFEETRDRYELALVRLEPDGRVDTSFGTNGRVEIVPPGFGSLAGGAVAIQPDAKVIVASPTCVRRWPPSPQPPRNDDENCDLVLLRYDEHGTLDPGFGNGGVATGPPSAEMSGTDFVDVEVDSKGGIVVASLSRVQRFGADGTPDLAFGRDGIRRNHYRNALVQQSDGRLLLNSLDDLVRLERDGAPDPTFDPEGGSLSFAVRSSGILRQPDDKIVRFGATDYVASLRRYATSGALDPTFGVQGEVRLELSDSHYFEVTAAALQPDFRIVTVLPVRGLVRLENRCPRSRTIQGFRCAVFRLLLGPLRTARMDEKRREHLVGQLKGTLTALDRLQDAESIGSRHRARRALARMLERFSRLVQRTRLPAEPRRELRRRMRSLRRGLQHLAT